LRAADGKFLLIATQNRGPLLVFKGKISGETEPVLPGDSFALITLANGKKQRIEFNFGASFLSQGGRFLVLPEGTSSCTITDWKGNTRCLTVNN